jgi:hypothetical protein
VRSYCAQLLAARRPGAPSGNELSLGSVFGEDQSGAAAGTPGGPDPSFDEFYADSAETPPIPATDAPAAAAEAPSDDLEGFTDWLRGLRR